jgi:hypothetical protein
MAIPRSGETMMKSSGSVHPPGIRAPKPAFAMAAPAYPPSRACDDELGIPPYQVTRSQTIAPMSPPRMTLGSTTSMSISPLPIALATAVPTTKAAMKLKNAAQNTATPGVSTRVETTVAMELALS